MLETSNAGWTTALTEARLRQLALNGALLPALGLSDAGTTPTR